MARVGALGTYLANLVKRDFYYFLFLPITAVGHAELIVFGAFAATGAMRASAWSDRENRQAT